MRNITTDTVPDSASAGLERRAADADFDLELSGTAATSEIAPKAMIYACCCCCCG